VGFGGFQAPTEIALTGAGVALRYLLDRAGPRLTYAGPEGDFSFDSQEIDDLETPIGRLLTVLLSAKPDFETLELTLLLPTINLPRGGAAAEQSGSPEPESLEFSTLAVLTTSRTSLAGPALVAGALQRYRVLTLRGRASAARL
jgi:hypothetical protein